MSCRPTQSLAQFVSIMSVACCQVCPNEEKFWAYRTYHLKISIIEVLLHTFEKNILEANICLKGKQDQNMNLGVLLGSGVSALSSFLRRAD